MAAIGKLERLANLARVENEIDVPPARKLVFLEAVERQADFESAAFLAGIPWSYLLWIADQAQKYPGGPAETFMFEVVQTQAMAKMKLTTTIVESSEWRAAAWMLERRYPEEFGKFKENGKPRERVLNELARRLKVGGSKVLEAAEDADA